MMVDIVIHISKFILISIIILAYRMISLSIPDQARPVEILNIARIKFLILLQLRSHAAESLAAKARNNLRMRSLHTGAHLISELF